MSNKVYEKQLPIQNAPMGIAGFETAMALSLTNLVHTKKLSLIDTINKFTYMPASVLNIPEQGIIEKGKEANLAIIDLNEEWIVDASRFKSKCRISPFDKQKLKGRVKKTIIKGKIYNIG